MTTLATMVLVAGEWEAAIAEGRTALELNPNSAFVMGILCRVLSDGEYYEEAIDHGQRALRASPHDPLNWAWTAFLGTSQFKSRNFAASLATMRQVVRLRPGHAVAYLYIAASLAHLGRFDEARQALERARAQFPEHFERYQLRPPYMRLQDWALLMEGMRLAAGEAA
jgi:adenylate cyclase